MIDLEALFQKWPQGVYVLDEHNGVLFANEKAAEITGYASEQVLDTPIEQWLEGNGTSIREEFVTGKVSYLYEHPDITIPQWWLGSSGEFLEVEAKLTLIDLPERSLKLLTFEEFDDPEQSLFFIRKLASFAALSPQPMAQVGLDGTLEYCNESLNDLMLEFGFSDSGFANVFPDKWQDYAEQCLEGGEPILAIEREIEGHWYHWNFHPIVDQVIPFVLVIGLDISEHIKHQKSLESINRMYAQANKQKSQFMAALNNEMQTPLSEIQTHLELLNELSLGDQEVEWLRNIQFASKVLVSLVDDSEDRLKLETNTLVIRQRSYNPRYIAGQMLEMLAPKINAKALKYYLIIDPTLPRRFEGDAKRFGQVIRVLLNNAIEYTERGAVVLKLSRRVQNQSTFLRASVGDSGCGISAQKLSSLFSDTANFGHSLPALKKIVQLMGGQIGAQSIEGRGSVFYMDIPCPEGEEPAPVFEHALTACLNFADKLWSSTLQTYLTFAGVEIVNKTDADLLFGDQQPDPSVATNVYLSQIPPKQNGWDYVLPSHCPPRFVFDLLQSVASGENHKSLVEIEKESTEQQFEFEPLELTVLLVDDDEKNLTVFTNLLTSLGCTVVQADSGEAAMGQWFMSGGTIQLILLDCKMPVQDGYQIAEQLRSENFDGPIIGMTTRRYEDEIDDALRFSMTTCVTKPLDAEDLYNLILDIF